MSDISEFAEWETHNHTLAKEELSQKEQRRRELRTELGDSSGDEVVQFGEREVFGVESDMGEVIGKDSGSENDTAEKGEEEDGDGDGDGLDEHSNRAQFMIMMEERECQAEMDTIDERIQAEMEKLNNTPILQTAKRLQREFAVPPTAQLLANFQADILTAPAEDLAEILKAGGSGQIMELGEAVGSKIGFAERMGRVFELTNDDDGDVFVGFRETMINAPASEINTLFRAQFADTLPVTLELTVPEVIQALVEGYAKEHPLYTSTENEEDIIEEFKNDVIAFARSVGLGIHTADLMARMAISTWRNEQTLEVSHEPTWDLSRRPTLQSAAEYYTPEAVAAAAVLVNTRKRKRKREVVVEMGEEAPLRARKRQRKRERKERKRAKKQANLAREARQKAAESAPDPQDSQAETTISAQKSDAKLADSNLMLLEPPLSNPKPKKRKRPKPGPEASAYFPKPQPSTSAVGSFSQVVEPQRPQTPTAKTSTKAPITSPYFAKPLPQGAFVTAVVTNVPSSYHLKSAAGSTIRSSRPTGMSRSAWRTFNQERQGGRFKAFLKETLAVAFLDVKIAPSFGEQVQAQKCPSLELPPVKEGRKPDILDNDSLPEGEMSLNSECPNKKRKRKQNKNRLSDFFKLGSTSQFGQVSQPINDPVPSQVNTRVESLFNDLPTHTYPLVFASSIDVTHDIPVSASSQPIPRKPQSHQSPEQPVANQSQPRSKFLFNAVPFAALTELNDTKSARQYFRQNRGKPIAEEASTVVTENVAVGAAAELLEMEPSMEEDGGEADEAFDGQVEIQTPVLEPEPDEQCQVDSRPLQGVAVYLDHIDNIADEKQAPENFDGSSFTSTATIVEEQHNAVADTLIGPFVNLPELLVDRGESQIIPKATPLSAPTLAPFAMPAMDLLLEIQQKIDLLTDQLKTVFDAVTRGTRITRDAAIVGIAGGEKVASDTDEAHVDEVLIEESNLTAEVEVDHNEERAVRTPGEPPAHASALGVKDEFHEERQLMWIPSDQHVDASVLNLNERIHEEVASVVAASDLISNNDPKFTYKFVAAKPTPPGVDDTEWNRIYDRANYRQYRKNGLGSAETKKTRERGDTYRLALKMLEEMRKDQNPKKLLPIDPNCSALSIWAEPGEDWTQIVDPVEHLRVQKRISKRKGRKEQPSQPPDRTQLNLTGQAKRHHTDAPSQTKKERNAFTFPSLPNLEAEETHDLVDRIQEHIISFIRDLKQSANAPDKATASGENRRLLRGATPRNSPGLKRSLRDCPSAMNKLSCSPYPTIFKADVDDQESSNDSVFEPDEQHYSSSDVDDHESSDYSVFEPDEGHCSASPEPAANNPATPVAPHSSIPSEDAATDNPINLSVTPSEPIEDHGMDGAADVSGGALVAVEDPVFVRDGDVARISQPKVSKLGAQVVLISGKTWYVPLSTTTRNTACMPAVTPAHPSPLAQCPRRNSNSHYSPPSTVTQRRKRRFTIGSGQLDVDVGLTPNEMSARISPLPKSIADIRQISVELEISLTNAVKETAPSNSKASKAAERLKKETMALNISRGPWPKDSKRKAPSPVAAVVLQEKDLPIEPFSKLPTPPHISADPNTVDDEPAMVKNIPNAVSSMPEPQSDAGLQPSIEFSLAPINANPRLCPYSPSGFPIKDINEDTKELQLAVGEDTIVVDFRPYQLEPAPVSQLKAQGRKAPAKSPYFPPSSPRKEKSEHFEQELSQRLSVSPSKSPRPAAGLVSCIDFPRFDAEKGFGLIQEQFADNPFKLLLAVTFLILTRGQVAIPVFYQLIAKYPTPEALHAAEKEDIVEMFQCLGLQNHRAAICQRYAAGFVYDPPVKGKRYVVKNYPTEKSTQNLKHGEILDDDDPCEAWEIGHMTSGHYALDSWRIFCRDKLRGLADGWNGEGAPPDFQSEWKRVLPKDKELRAFLHWMWLKEDFEWDPLTGDIEVADCKLVLAAREGWVSYDEQGGLRITEEEGPHIKFVVPRTPPSSRETTASSSEELVLLGVEPGHDSTPVSGVNAYASSFPTPRSAFHPPVKPAKTVEIPNNSLATPLMKSTYFDLILHPQTKDYAQSNPITTGTATRTSPAPGNENKMPSPFLTDVSLQQVARAALGVEDDGLWRLGHSTMQSPFFRC